MLMTLSYWPTKRRSNKTGSRTAPQPFLTDSQWNLIRDLFENPDTSPLGGRPRVEPRACLEGIIWILKTGAQWKYLPDQYPSSSTCWRRLKEWTERGLLEQAWQRLVHQHDQRGRLQWKQMIGDATFSSAKKGAKTLVEQRSAKAPSSCC